MQLAEITATLECREKAARESRHPDAYQVVSLEVGFERGDGVMKLHHRPVEARMNGGLHRMPFCAHVSLTSEMCIGARSV